MKSDKNKFREPITVYLRPEACAAVQELAKKRKIPVSRLIRQSLTKYLKVSCLLIGLLGGCVHQEEEVAPVTTPSQEPAPTPTPTQAPTPEPTAWPDKDGDGYTADKDCDDTDIMIFPGMHEFCDGIDQDCNGRIDEGVSRYYYIDEDNDYWPISEGSWQTCEWCPYIPEMSWAICVDQIWDSAWDCNDKNSYEHPGASDPYADCDSNTP